MERLPAVPYTVDLNLYRCRLVAIEVEMDSLQEEKCGEQIALLSACGPAGKRTAVDGIADTRSVYRAVGQCTGAAARTTAATAGYRIQKSKKCGEMIPREFVGLNFCLLCGQHDPRVLPCDCSICTTVLLVKCTHDSHQMLLSLILVSLSLCAGTIECCDTHPQQHA